MTFGLNPYKNTTMKHIVRISALAASLAIVSCTTPTGMTMREYSGLTAPTNALAFPAMITFTVDEPGQPAREHLAVNITEGEMFEIGDQLEFLFPGGYDLASSSADGLSITPTTPTSFKTEFTGFSAALTASREGSLILIRGVVNIRKFMGFSRMGGELGKPIIDKQGKVLSENRIEMPKFVTFTTPVYVALKAGESSVFEIAHPIEGARVSVSLEPRE